MVSTGRGVDFAYNNPRFLAAFPMLVFGRIVGLVPRVGM